MKPCSPRNTQRMAEILWASVPEIVKGSRVRRTNGLLVTRLNHVNDAALMPLSRQRRGSLRKNECSLKVRLRREGVEPCTYRVWGITPYRGCQRFASYRELAVYVIISPPACNIAFPIQYLQIQEPSRRGRRQLRSVASATV